MSHKQVHNIPSTLIDLIECRHKFSIFTVNSELRKGKNEILLSQFVANYSVSMDFAQSRLDFLSKENVDSLHLPLCAWRRSESKILLFMSIFLGELSVKFIKLFRKNQKRKALTMQLAHCSNDKELLWMEGNF